MENGPMMLLADNCKSRTFATDDSRIVRDAVRFNTLWSNRPKPGLAPGRCVRRILTTARQPGIRWSEEHGKDD